MKLFKWSNGHFIVLSTEPVVILMKDWLFYRPAKEQWLTLQFLRRRNAHILVSLSWTHEKAGMVTKIAKRVGRYQRHYRNHHVTVLTSTLKEQQLLEAKGLDTLYCNGSVLLNTSLFHPIPGCKKDFDAVYDAVLSPYKRHHLARDVRKLALITYRKGDSTQAYLRSALDVLDHANWLNGGPDREMQWLDDQAVNESINRARVGLCLSAEEGYMNASAQYLLAGLPVVTTRSLGGRDVFYEPGFVREVADTPKAVSQAVEELCATAPSADSIRQRTMEKFMEHRGRFVRRMQDILANCDPDGVWQRGWPQQLPHKLYGGDITVRENLEALKNPQLGAPWLTAGQRAKDS